MSDLKSRVLLALLGLAVLVGGPYLFAYVGHVSEQWALLPSVAGAFVSVAVGLLLTVTAASRV